jgi:tRNA threonylcarbamoyladenosine modification (KEOPS) complex  Pcc1 subunit
MITAGIRLVNPDNRILLGTISPELKSEFTRTNVTAERDEDGLTLKFEAEDVSALRASMNSYLIWLKVVEDVMTATGNSDLNNDGSGEIHDDNSHDGRNRKGGR